MERIEPFKEKVVILKGFSYKMANDIPDNSLGHVHIDCDHSYNGTKSDAEIYWGKLVDGGVMTFHDYANPAYGVWRAVREFAQKHELEINMLTENGELDNYGCYFIKQ